MFRRFAALQSAAFALLLLAATLIVPLAARAQDATPIPTPTPVPSADGTIDQIELITKTPRSIYYAITYWSDGLRVTGFLGKPTGPGPFPAIIHNRGGFGDTGALTGGELAAYVEAGYVAVATQYRGNGGGEGQEDFGGDDVHDVTNLVPLLHSLPFVDRDRIGMFGGSRGGMMAFIALKNQTLAGRDDIKVAVTVGGISDLFAWDRERGGTLASILWFPLVGTTPQRDPAPFEERSAVYWPELITVPLLMMHGEADQDVSIQQTYALAEKLGEVGANFDYITFPGGDHPLSMYQGGYPDALAWFAQYLGGDGVDRSFATHQDAIQAMWAWFSANPQTR